jgi:hypothetical protein
MESVTLTLRRLRTGTPYESDSMAARRHWHRLGMLESVLVCRQDFRPGMFEHLDVSTPSEQPLPALAGEWTLLCCSCNTKMSLAVCETNCLRSGQLAARLRQSQPNRAKPSRSGIRDRSVPTGLLRAVRQSTSVFGRRKCSSNLGGGVRLFREALFARPLVWFIWRFAGGCRSAFR